MKVLDAHPGQQSKDRSVALWVSVLFVGFGVLGSWFLIRPALSPGIYYKVGFNRNTFEYGRQILLLFIPYVLVLRAWRKGSRIPMWAIVGGALLLHLLVLFAPLPQSQDFYQYLFYGKMQAIHHVNPYLVQPRRFWADPWFPWSLWHNQTSVYGPAWMLVTAGVARIAGHSLTVAYVSLKLVILALDVTVMALIATLTRDRTDRRSSAGWGLLAFAWNPLVLITVPLAGAADVAVGAAFLGAVLARRRGHTALATVLLTLASLVKAYAAVALLLHLVLVIRERGWLRAGRQAGLAAAIGAVLYWPYWAGLRTLRGLIQATGLTNLSFTGTLQLLLVHLFHAVGYTTPYAAHNVIRPVVAGVLILIAVWAVLRVRTERDLWYMTVVVLVAYFYLTPWFLYWYMLGPLALVAVIDENRLTLPVIAFSGSVFGFVRLHTMLSEWVASAGFQYLPPVAVYAVMRWREARATSREEAPQPAPAHHGSSGAVLRIPVPSTAAVLRTEPAAE